MLPRKVILAVPGRLNSSRLPGKVLADIGGKPMIKRVLEQCTLTPTDWPVVLCTDSDDLAGLSHEWGYPCLMTPDSCQSGSERIASVIDELVALAWDSPKSGSNSADWNARVRNTVVINVQGDQPFLDPEIMRAIGQELVQEEFIPEIVTAVYPLNPCEIHDPAVVKTLMSSEGKALYFSRSAIPHIRGLEPSEWHEHYPYLGHVGIYGFRGDVLAGWGKIPCSRLAQAECLEQLQLIEAGYTIKCIRLKQAAFSVDTAEQLKKARQMARLFDK